MKRLQLNHNLVMKLMRLFELSFGVRFLIKLRKIHVYFEKLKIVFVINPY